MDSPHDLQPEQRLDESELLLALYRSLIENADLASGLRSALEIVCQFADWAVGTAWLPVEDRSRLEFVAGWQADDPELSEFISACAKQSFPPNFGMVGRVWGKRKPEWTRNLAAELREAFPFAPLALDAGLSAALCVPIARGNEIDGVLAFHSRAVKDEDDRVVQVISRVASQLGFALHHKQTELELRRRETRVRRGNEELGWEIQKRTSSVREANALLQAEVAARTHVENRLEQRVRQQAAVAEIGRRALQEIELSALMDQTAALVTQVLGVEFCKILELSPDKQTLLLRAGTGWKEGCIGMATVSAGAKSQAGYTLLSRAPVVVENLQTETRFSGSPLLRDHRILSGMSVIIGQPDRPYGVLGAHSTALRVFTKEDIHFLEAVATMLFQIIERDAVMKEIRRSANWLEQLIHTTQDAVISIDRRGCIVLFNTAAEKIFGYRAEEIVGRKVNDLMAEPYASEHDGYIDHYERTREPRAIGRIRTVEGRRKSGEVFPLELSVTEIEVDQDVHYAAFIRDISEKTKLQAQLIESDRLATIGTTAAKIGHELANPLNGMSLTIQLLEQRLDRQTAAVDGQIVSTVRRLKNETARLNKLVGEFATISRRGKYVLRPMNLAEVIDDVVNLQEPHFARLGIELTKSISGDLPSVNIDADKLKQALLNLLKNAGEATSREGKVNIDAFVSDNTVCVEISDTGTGIPIDIDAFEPFVTTKKEGTGVGLVVVRQILTAHGGKISYRSQPGQGTTFLIELPRA